MANTKFQIRRSSVSGRLPNTSDPSNTAFIDAGELAINLADEKVYSSNGTVSFEVGANLSYINVSGNATINAIIANGNIGTNNQVLVSNGSGIFWSSVAGGGDTLTNVNFTASNSTLTITTTATAISQTFNYANSSTPGFIQLIDSTSNTAANIAASANSVKVAFDAAGNSFSNATAFAANADNIASGTLNTARLPATANISTAINVGANVNLSTTTINVGNSTVNSFITSNAASLGNTTITGFANISSTLAAGNTTITGFANVSGNLQLSGIFFQGTDQVNSQLITTDKYIAAYENTAPGFNFVVASNTSTSHRGVFKATRSRGNLLAPTVPLANDDVLSFLAAVYDGDQTLATGEIKFIVDGTVSDNVAPQAIVFSTGNTNARIARMRINSSGDVGIGTTAPGARLNVVANTTTDAVRITQTGTGNALVVEDEANPDSTPTVIDSSGRLIVGSSSDVTANVFTAGIQSVGTGPGALFVARYANSTVGPNIYLYKSRDALVGTNASPLLNDSLGALIWLGFDGNTIIRSAAQINAKIDGTPGANSMPGRLEFSTSANGSFSPTLRLTIDSNGTAAVNGSILENNSPVVVQTDIGTAPNEIPLNQYLGSLAYQDASSIAGPMVVGGSLLAGEASLGNTTVTGFANVSGTVFANSIVLIGTESSSTLDNNDNITGWYLTDKRFSVAAQETGPNGIFFKPDGTKMYIVGSSGDDINEYDLSTAWDIDTASFVGQSAFLGETSPQDLFISSNGTKCYVVGSTNDSVREFDFGTPFQANTLTFVQEFSVAAQEITPTGITFKPDLTQMFICGSTGDGVDVYDLSSAGNVATATVNTFVSLAAQDTAPSAIQFNDDGTEFYMMGTTGDDINQYNLSTPYDLTTATFFNSSFYLGFVENVPTGFFLREDENRVWIVGNQIDSVLEMETRGDGLRATGDSNYFDGYVYVQKDFDVRGSAIIETNFFVAGTATLGSTTTIIGSVTMSTTSGTLNLGTSQTTGVVTIGGTTSTGLIRIGRSTANQSIFIGDGVTTSGNVKTIDIGTLGASGSNTNITIGSATSGAVTTINLHGTVLENTSPIVVQTDIGTAPNEIPLNQYLGSMAYLDADNISFDARGTNTAEQNLAINKLTTVVISANTTLTTTVPLVGSTAFVIVITSGATSRTVTFGTGFKSTGTLATGTTADRRFVFQFISDGTNLVEVSRTTAITY